MCLRIPRRQWEVISKCPSGKRTLRQWIRTQQLKFGFRGWRHCESIIKISGFKIVCNFYENIIYFLSFPIVTVMMLDLQKSNLGAPCVMRPRINSDHLHLLPMIRRNGTVLLYFYFSVFLRCIHSENFTSKIYCIFGQQYSHNEELQFLVALILTITHSWVWRKFWHWVQYFTEEMSAF